MLCRLILMSNSLMQECIPLIINEYACNFLRIFKLLHYSVIAFQHVTLQHLCCFLRRTPWLIVGGHRPIYISSNWNGIPAGDIVVSNELRSTYEDLFIQHKVGGWLVGLVGTSTGITSVEGAIKAQISQFPLFSVSVLLLPI